MKIVLISGPPRCGKDTFAKTLGELLAEMGARVIATPLACVLKSMTHGLYAGMHGEQFIPAWDAFEDKKEEENDFFDGKTPRQAWIDMQEQYIRPILGKDFIAREKVEALLSVAGGFEVAIIPDLGNIEQVLPFEEFGDPMIIRMSRKGKEWTDNREPIGVPNQTVFDFANDGTTDDMKAWIKTVILSAVYSGR